MSDIENTISEIESYLNDSVEAADECVSYAETASGEADNARNELSTLTDAFEELENERDELREKLNGNDADKLRAEIKTLRNELQFENAKLNRVIEFIGTIAMETVTMEGDASTQVDAFDAPTG